MTDLSTTKPAGGSADRSAILLIHCPDQTGIIASVTDYIFRNGGNIIDLDQHVDGQRHVFFMRVQWSLKGFAIEPSEIGPAFHRALGERLKMRWKLYFSDQVPRMAVFVSRLPHCLHDILSRWHSGEWNVEIPLIVSNHEDLMPIAESFGIDFHFLPVAAATKQAVERRQLELLTEYGADLIVLARYMQILSESFIDRYSERIINIHHSFLPAFAGARPYHAAHARGVKIIGATSHYVTRELDAGPIIDQDVVRITHKDSVDELVRKGRDLEKIVLARAVWSHVQRNVLCYDNRTVVFG